MIATPEAQKIVRAKRAFDLIEDADRMNKAERDAASTAVEILRDLETSVAAILTEQSPDEHTLLAGVARVAVRQWQESLAKEMGVEL